MTEFVTFANRYDESNFVESKADLRYHKYGVYISPINNIYLKLGVSQVKGTTWNVFKGSFPTHEVPTTSPGLYVVDFDSDYSETGPTCSIKNRKIFRIGLDIMVSVQISSSVKRVNFTRMQDFSSRAFTYKYRNLQTDLLLIRFV